MHRSQCAWPCLSWSAALGRSLDTLRPEELHWRTNFTLQSMTPRLLQKCHAWPFEYADWAPDTQCKELELLSQLLCAHRSWHAALGLSERMLTPKELHHSLVTSFPYIQRLDLRQCKEPAPGTLSMLAGLRGLKAVCMQLNNRLTCSGLMDELQQLVNLRELYLSG